MICSREKPVKGQQIDNWAAQITERESTSIHVVDTFFECLHCAMSCSMNSGDLKTRETQLTRILSYIRIIFIHPIKLSKFKFRKQWEKTFIAWWLGNLRHSPMKMALEGLLHYKLFFNWAKELLCHLEYGTKLQLFFDNWNFISALAWCGYGTILPVLTLKEKGLMNRTKLYAQKVFNS